MSGYKKEAVSAVNVEESQHLDLNVSKDYQTEFAASDADCPFSDRSRLAEICQKGL
jgi:hypothetical protein